MKNELITQRDEKGRYIAVQKTTWCMSYNKDNVSEDELPETWWDLVAEDSQEYPIADAGLGAEAEVSVPITLHVVGEDGGDSEGDGPP